MYLALMVHKEINLVDGATVRLPETCDGVVFVFKTKKAARKWYGKKVELVKVTRDENKDT